MGSSQTIQKFAFEGPLSLGQLIILSSVILLLTAFFTFRECNVSGSSKRFVILFPVRLVALLCVFWMLAGATITTVRRETRPSSVLIFVDSSDSMGLVDPIDGSGNAVRWCAASRKEEDFPKIDGLNRIIGKLRAAQSAVHRLMRQNQDEPSSEKTQALWKQLAQSAESATAELGGFSLDPSRSDLDMKAELGRTTEFLKSGLASLLYKPETSDSEKRNRLQPSGEEQLEQAEEFLQAGLRRLEHLAQTLTVRYEQIPTSHEQSVLASQSKVARKDKVKEWLAAGEASWLKETESKSRVLRYAFASKVVAVPDNSWGEPLARSNNAAGTTDLAAALDRAAQDCAQQSVSAVLLITDGGHNAPGNPRETAAGLQGVPFYIVPIGDQQMPRDVILHHTHCPRTVFKNDTLILDAMVTAYDCDGEELQIDLMNGNTVIENKKILVSSKFFDGRIEFRWKASELGRHRLRLRVTPVAREHSLENNEAQAEVEVMEDTIRVLIADSRPRWEFRYLVNLFKRDKHVDFEQLLFEPKDETAGGPSLPRDLESWRRYRVIILGDLTPEQFSLSQQELLKKFVAEEAGNLIVIGGDTAMPSAFGGQPLAMMLPTISSASSGSQDQPRSLTVTPEGSLSVATQLDDDPLASDRIWREMSSKVPIYFSADCRPKPTSHVLISATIASSTATPKNSDSQTEAFLSWQYVGLGRVVYLAAPVTYQLRYRNGDTYHHRFWGQLLRWAIAREMSSGSKTVHLITDKSSYEKGDTAQISIRLAHADGRVVSAGQVGIEARREGQLLKSMDLQEDPHSPGVYRATYDDLPLGPIFLRAAGPTVRSLLSEENHPDAVEQVLTVDPKGSTELSNPLCNLPLLTQIADASGGAVLSPASVPAMLTETEAIPDVQDTVVHRQPAWNRWSYLWIILGCLTFEWLARKYWRME
jgi:hypothetical protein